MPRRLLLAFVVVLCLGLSLPALAEQGQGGGPDSGQGGGPPTPPTTHATGPPTTVTNPGNGNGQGGPPTTVTNPGNGNDNGQGGPPTTVTNPGHGNGNGDGNGQGSNPPTTVTTQSSDSSGSGGSGGGQGSNPPTTVTTHTSGSSSGGNGQRNNRGEGNGQSNGTLGPSTTVSTDQSTAGGASADAPGVAAADRIAVFLAPMRVFQEIEPSQPVGVGSAQSSPERMISWLLSTNEQRFLPVVASPLVALLVVGRALASAGSGAVAPIALLVALAATKQMDSRRGRRLAAIPASN